MEQNFGSKWFSFITLKKKYFLKLNFKKYAGEFSMSLLKLDLGGLPWWSSGKDCAPNAGAPAVWSLDGELDPCAAKWINILKIKFCFLPSQKNYSTALSFFWPVCVCVYIYICVCVCIYIYIFYLQKTNSEKHCPIECSRTVSILCGAQVLEIPSCLRAVSWDSSLDFQI